jgi:hypothetical protein
MIRAIYRKIIPMPLRASYRIMANLLSAHGAYRSFSAGPVTANGEPLAYITYSALSYLLSLNLKNKRVFEFGSGSSTKFWARVAGRVVSVEGDPAWYERVRTTLPENVTLHFCADASPESYLAPLTKSGEKFDIIFIDGSHRPACATACRPFLAAGGIVIHDNTEWYQETRRILLSYDLLPVDFFGFIPSSAFTGVTSFYFDRNCALKPSSMPPWIPGSVTSDHEGHSSVGDTV